MDFGGIIAGAMAGGGQAIQQNAMGDLEEQRQKALTRLEQRMAQKSMDYEYGKKSEIATQNAKAAAEQQKREAVMNRNAAIRDSQLNMAEEAQSQSLKARLDTEGGESALFNDLYDRAAKRTNRDYKGRVDIASNATYGSDVETPEYNRLLADNLRREAAALNDQRLKQRLNRQADAIESNGGQGGGNGNITSQGADPLNLRN